MNSIRCLVIVAIIAACPSALAQTQPGAVGGSISKPREPAAANAGASLTGRWQITMDCGGMGSAVDEATFSQTGGTFTGSFARYGGISNGQVKGRQISFTLDRAGSNWNGAMGSAKSLQGTYVSLGMTCKFGGSKL